MAATLQLVGQVADGVLALLVLLQQPALLVGVQFGIGVRLPCKFGPPLQFPVLASSGHGVQAGDAGWEMPAYQLNLGIECR